jgi:hypothetical protein
MIPPLENNASTRILSQQMPSSGRGGESGRLETGPTTASADDSAVTQALKEYLAALEAGQQPVREDFEARHPEIAGNLWEYLDGLEFIQQAAPRIHEAAPDMGLAGFLHPGMAEGECALGDFRIVREVGRGGMGVVFEAVQLSLDRRRNRRHSEYGHGQLAGTGLIRS